MKTRPAPDWLFEVEETPLFTTINRAGENGERTFLQVPVPRRKALIAADTGDVLGIVGEGYRVFSNREAVELCRKFCLEAFKDTCEAEWNFSEGCGPSTRSWAALDIRHLSAAMNITGTPGGASDTYTPFVRITNSYNGSRAVCIDIGFMRKHCENGVIFERKAATISVPHTREGIAALKVARPFAKMAELCKTFESTLAAVRSVPATEETIGELVRLVVGWPKLPDNADKKARTEQERLDADLTERTSRYLSEIGSNAYAAFNVMTDLAARPPVSIRFRRDRPSLERRAGAWLKHFTTEAAKPDFVMEKHLATYSPVETAPPPHQRMQPA